MNKPRKLDNLIQSIKSLPGIGSKNAERLAYSILKNKYLQRDLPAAIIDIKDITMCVKCHVISDETICAVCANPNREKSLCIVPTSKELFQIEETGIYKGYYHVLNGEINIQKGINPENLNIEDIKNRIENDKIKEMILALNLTIQGETTSMYISDTYPNIKVSRLAQGIPLGQTLEHVDAFTLERAFRKRGKI